MSPATVATIMNKRHLLVLCLCLALITFQGTITVRLLPVYAVHLGADPATAGLLVAFAFLMVTLGNIAGGWLSDRLGFRKPILLLSCAVWIPATLLMTQATDMPRLIVMTGLLWFPGGIALAMVNIITALFTGPGERGRVFGWTALAAGVGALLAGAIGGPVAEHWGFPTLFVVMAAATAVILVAASSLPDMRTQRAVAQRRGEQDAAAGKQPGVGHLLPLLLGANLLMRLSVLMGGLAIPLAMTQLGFDAAAVAGAIVVSAAVTLPLPLLLGWLSDKAGRKRFLVICYGLGALGLLLLIPALQLWQFWLAAALLAVAEASGGVAQAFVADLVSPHAMGRGMSLFNSTNLFAGIVGVGGAGYLIQAIGMDAMLLLGACLPLIGIGLLFYLRKPAPAVDTLVIAEAPNTAAP